MQVHYLCTKLSMKIKNISKYAVPYVKFGWRLPPIEEEEKDSYLYSTISSSVICDQAVVKSHFWMPKRPVLGCTPFHSFAPQAKRVGMKLVSHEVNDVRFWPASALPNCLKGGAVFPSHLNDGRDVSPWKSLIAFREFFCHSNLLTKWRSSSP